MLVLPTKSNNIGGRGGKRAGAGRKKKSNIEKVQNGNPSGRTLSMLDIPHLEGVDMPSPNEYLSREQKDGSILQAKEIYEETWRWLDKLNISQLVHPSLIERYAMSSARWIQCEEITSKLGFLSKHPTTGNPIPSPFINIGINYMNQALKFWNEIFQIVKENSSKEFDGLTPQDDMMERLLRSRKGL